MVYYDELTRQDKDFILTVKPGKQAPATATTMLFKKIHDDLKKNWVHNRLEKERIHNPLRMRDPNKVAESQSLLEWMKPHYLNMNLQKNN